MEHTDNGETLRIIIENDMNGITLGEYLRRHMHFTKAQIKRMKFGKEHLKINGEQVRINTVLRPKDVLEIPLNKSSEQFSPLEHLEKPLDILYEDHDLIAVWKPAGMAVHPSGGHYQDTLSNCVQAYYHKQGKNVCIRSIGRLDKDTSGIVIFASNQVAAARLWKQKEAGIFYKEYAALCEGTPGTDGGWHTIDSPIGKAPDHSIRMQISPDGKPAVTHYRSVLTIPASKNRPACTLLSVRIDTGRTHQIRVHMASIGHPLVGDPLYGSGLTGTAGAQLCACKSIFRQPFTEKEICLTRPNPFLLV